MIDHLDKQTQPLPLDQKRGRGRPATGQALSNAERQRLYRERQKAQRNEKSESGPVPYSEVVAIAQELGERCKAAEAKLRVELELGEKARKRVKELEAQLAQRNEKQGKGLTYRKLTEYALDQLKDNEKRAKPEMAKEWSFGAYMLWQSLAVTMNVQKAALEADMEKMRGMAGLEPRSPK